MSTVRSVFLLLVLAFSFGVMPESVSAATALESYAGCSGVDCSACNLVSLANGVIVWLIGFLCVLFGVIVAVAGFGLVTSGGNRHALDEAKNMFTGAIVGLIIVLAAWLIVDTIMRGLLGSGENAGKVDYGEVTGWLFWSEVQCYEQVEPAEFEEYLPDEANMLLPGNITQITTIQPGGTYQPTSEVSRDSGYTYQPGIQAQAGDTSNELQMLLNCMLSQLPGNVGEISSISDSNIVSGSKTWQQCWEGQCNHSAGSCHYGNGTGVIGRSYAVDFGDENNAQDLMGAAAACGAGYVLNEGDHIHVSALACAGN